MLTIAEQLVTFFPPLDQPAPGNSQHPVSGHGHVIPERVEMLTKLSGWLRRQSEDVVSANFGQIAHCDSLKVLRFITRCAIPDDDVSGAVELIFEGVLSTYFRVRHHGG